MPQHRFTLEPYKTPQSRYTCPQCNHRQTFSRYIDTQTGNYLNDAVGRCSRESNCGYHLTPGIWFRSQQFATGSKQLAGSNNQLAVKKPILQTACCKLPTENKPHYIAQRVARQSLTAYTHNNLAIYLCHVLGDRAAFEVIHKYCLGTDDHWPGASVFWQIDGDKRVRTGKVMLYNPNNGKRVKQPYNHIQWVHKILYQAGYNLQQCLFGQHLLSTNKNKPVAIVESEKTAMIAAAHMPKYTWLATGGSHNLNKDKCSVLQGRNVILFPDVGAYELWQSKAAALGALIPDTRFRVSALLEDNATFEQRKQGCDLGDYLVG